MQRRKCFLIRKEDKLIAIGYVQHLSHVGVPTSLETNTVIIYSLALATKDFSMEQGYFFK